MHWEQWAIARVLLRDRKHNTGCIKCRFIGFRDKIKEDLQEKQIREDNYFICDVLKRWRCFYLEL